MPAFFPSAGAFHGWKAVSSVGGLSRSDVLDGVACAGWWLVVDDEAGPGRIVAGPFPDRVEASWAVGSHPSGARPVYGFRRADGGLNRRPSPQEWAWLAHLGEQLDRLPEDWDAGLADDHPLGTLVVEVTAALAEAGLPLHDEGGPIGGACLTPEPALDGIVVSWRQHDRMSVDQVHGAGTDVGVQHVMNRALTDVLVLRGFEVDSVGGVGGAIVRAAAAA
jgi:hypothetical protein